MTATLAARNATAHVLRCPKCAAEMVTYERSGVVVDQCRECRGIFLDRGELERVVDAESGGAGWTGPHMAAPAPYPLQRVGNGWAASPDPRQPGYRSEWRDHDDDDDARRDDGARRDRRGDWDDRGRWDGRAKPQKRHNVLSDRVEGFGD